MLTTETVYSAIKEGEEVLDALNRYSVSSIIDCDCGKEDEVLDAKVIDG